VSIHIQAFYRGRVKNLRLGAFVRLTFPKLREMMMKMPPKMKNLRMSIYNPKLGRASRGRVKKLRLGPFVGVLLAK